jgi:hypothetical protein
MRTFRRLLFVESQVHGRKASSYLQAVLSLDRDWLQYDRAVEATQHLLAT